MDKTELPFTVKDGMLTGPNGSWRIKDISAVFTTTKSHVFQNHLYFYLWLCIACVVAGSLTYQGVIGFVLALAVFAPPVALRVHWMRTSSDTVQVEAVISGAALAIWKRTYGSSSEPEAKAQSEAILSLIRNAIERSPEAKEKAAP
jgi:hypothetical protein